MSNLRVIRDLCEGQSSEPPTQALEEPVQLSQPSAPEDLRPSMEETFQRQVRPRLEVLGNRPSHASLDSNARALVILLEVGRVAPGGPKMLFGGCFEGLNKDQLLGWDVLPTEVLVGSHRRCLRGPVDHVDKEHRTEFIATLLRRILDFLEM